MAPDRHPPRPVRKARPVSWVGPSIAAAVAVLVLVGLFLFGAGAESLRHKDEAATAKAGPRPSPTPGPTRRSQLGRPVRDGKFEFVVSRVDCSQTSVGLEHLRRTASGKYCVVSLSVRNVGDQPRLFLGSAQKAADAAGTSFTDDELAAFYANHDTQTFLRKIDPGGRVTGKLVFDVPKATTLTSLELHDSPFSGGVAVTLG